MVAQITFTASGAAGRTAVLTVQAPTLVGDAGATLGASTSGATISIKR